MMVTDCEGLDVTSTLGDNVVQRVYWDEEIEKQLFPYQLEPFNIWAEQLFWYSYSDAEDIQYEGLKDRLKSVVKLLGAYILVAILTVIILILSLFTRGKENDKEEKTKPVYIN